MGAMRLAVTAQGVRSWAAQAHIGWTLATDHIDRFALAERPEPPRFCRRLRLLRRWSHDGQDDEQVLP